MQLMRWLNYKKTEKISKQLIEAQRLAIHQQTGQTTGEKFFLTEQEFKLVESHYNKISQRMEKALGHTFIEERIQFSKPNIDPTYIAQALTACISSFVAVQSNESTQYLWGVNSRFSLFIIITRLTIER